MFIQEIVWEMRVALGKRDQVSELHCPGRKWSEFCSMSISFLREIAMSYYFFLRS